MNPIVCISVNSFHINPTSFSEEKNPPLSYTMINDIFRVNCDNDMHVYSTSHYSKSR